MARARRRGGQPAGAGVGSAQTDWPASDCHRAGSRLSVCNDLARWRHDAVPRGAAAVPPLARTNVPAAVDLLIGRDADVDDLPNWIAAHRLVTLLGPGGIGKTRLAQAVARANIDSHAGGVWWVDLAPLSSADQIALGIASAARLQLEVGVASAQLVRALVASEMLLVLDNCEHLAHEVASLVHAVLRGDARVRILTTSQVALKVDGEHLYLLSPLAMPPPGVSLATARQFAAVQLLEHRARAADPRFSLTESTVSHAIDLCHQLDGVALSIEMAAARLPLLGVHGLHARLGERLTLLRTDCREAPSRQQTLHAALDWSHELLDVDERAVLRRLAVFAGGFRLDAAQQTAAAPGLDGDAVLDALGGLVDKSLVAVDSSPTPRYRMHETMRLFALQELSASNEMAATMRRHAAAMLAILDEVDRKAWTLTGDAMHAQLAAELDNVRAALAWAGGDLGDPAVGVALVAKSTWLWDALNLGAEGIAHLLAFERWACDPAPLALQADYWRARTFHHMGCGGQQNLYATAARSIALTRRVGDSRSLYDALVRSAVIAARSGRVDVAQQNLVEAAALEDTSWPPRQRATRRFADAECFEALDRLGEARAAQQARITLLAQAGERAVEVHAQSQLLALELASGDVKGAIARGRLILAGLPAHSPPFRARSLQMVLAQAMVVAGLLDEAVPLLIASVPLLVGSAAQWQALDLLAQLWAKRGDPYRAARLLACADHQYEVHGLARKPHVGRARAGLLSGLAERVPAAEWARLQHEGESLTEEQSIAMAMDFGFTSGPQPS